MFQRFFTELRAARLPVSLKEYVAVISFAVAFGITFPVAAEPEPSGGALQTEATRLIAEANAADFFVPVSAPPAVAVRHVASGMLCRLGAPGRLGEIEIISSEAQGIHLGDDVRCVTRAGASLISLYATRTPETPTQEIAFRDAVGALRQVHTSAQLVGPAELQWVTLGDRPPPPPSATAAFRVNVNGQEAFTRVSIYVANGWIYKLRFTSPSPSDNYIADVFWIMMLTELTSPAQARTP